MSDKDEAVEKAESQDAPGDEPEVESMDDEALDKYLAETPDESEPAGEKEGEKESTTTPPDDSEGDKTAEGAPAPVEADDPAKMREELDRLRKQVGDKEKYIQDRNREVGELRKQLRDEASKLREGVPDLFMESPVKAIENVLMAREREERAAMLEMESAWDENKAKVLAFSPNFESRVEEIAEIAKGDGVPPEMVRAFKTNPYATSPQLLHALLKRADDAKELKTLRDRLVKEKKEKDGVAERIAKAAAKTSGVTGKTPGASPSSDRFKNVTESDLDDLSDADLDALLEREG